MSKYLVVTSKDMIRYISYTVEADSQEEAENILKYLKTKFVRFLIAQIAVSQHITKNCFSFVPLQDFSKAWTDEELYAKYGLTEEEIEFIESMIRPMEG